MVLEEFGSRGLGFQGCPCTGFESVFDEFCRASIGLIKGVCYKDCVVVLSRGPKVS